MRSLRSQRELVGAGPGTQVPTRLRVSTELSHHNIPLIERTTCICLSINHTHVTCSGVTVIPSESPSSSEFLSLVYKRSHSSFRSLCMDCLYYLLVFNKHYASCMKADDECSSSCSVVIIATDHLPGERDVSSLLNYKDQYQRPWIMPTVCLHGIVRA